MVGGDVSLENGGRLNALGGRVELGGLVGVGAVGLGINGNIFSLSFTPDSFLSNVTLTNDARVGVRGAGGGNIVVNANTFTATNGGRLVAGTEGLGNGGDITVNANDFRLSGVGLSGFASGLYSQVLESASGNAGNIFINTISFNALSGAQLQALTLGQGDAGSVNINAHDTVSFDGSYAFSTVGSRALGNSGGINITTGSLFVTAGAQLDTFTSGQGNAGSVNINANDNVSLDGVGNRVASAVLSTVESGGKGNGGEITIRAGSLSLTDGGQLLTRVRKASSDGTSAAGQGNTGNVNIDVRDTVTIAGANSNGLTSRVDSRAEDGVTGNSGDINLTAGSLTVTGGSVLTTSAYGRGNGGNVTITARDRVSFDGISFLDFSSGIDTFAAGVGNSGNINIATSSLSLTNGAQVSANIAGQGNAGNVTITARDIVSFDGVGSNGNSSAVATSMDTTAVGKGGDINITTGSLSLTNGAGLIAVTAGQGNAGNVTITARDTVSFDGVGSNGYISGASVFSTATMGNAGDINITTGSLALTNGAALASGTRGRGDAGSVTITADDTVSFDGVNGGFSSGVFSTVESGAVGKGGDINITTESLSVTNSALLAANSEGSGAAGSIEVEASSIRLDNQASLSSDTVAGQGNIFLRSENLVLRRSSNITTNATGIATGGNITIDTDILAALEDSDITANAQEAFGGRVIVEAQGIFGTQFREAATSESDITATSELGAEFSGTVELNTPDTDLNSGLVSLPTVPVDTQVAQACTPGGSQANSEFVVTGRGGLPPSPNDALSSDAISVDWVTLNPDLKNQSSPADISTNKTDHTPAPIVEAQGWVIGKNGDIVLTATPATATASIPWLSAANCQTVKTRS